MFILSKLEASRHMFDLLSDAPFEQIQLDLIDLITEQISGSHITRFQAIGEPDWLSLGRRDESGENAILVRLGVAFAFEMDVTTPEHGDHALTGVYTWVANGLDTADDQIQRIWMDLSGDLDEMGSKGKLRDRIYLDRLSAVEVA